MKTYGIEYNVFFKNIYSFLLEHVKEEIDWKNNFRIWMEFVNDYKNRGGRVTVGSDSGFIFKLFGFDCYLISPKGSNMIFGSFVNIKMYWLCDIVSQNING